MTTKLATITAQYRSFVNDQVLTADQLNTLIQYFEDQDRLSRIYLCGVGLAYGFKLQLTSTKEIVVTQGCGVTTDGDLIQLQKPGQSDNDRIIDFKNIKYTHYKVFEDTSARYQPFFQNGMQFPAFELIPESQNPNSDSFALSTLSQLEKMVALLYLEEFSKAPELCTAIDCNNQGVEEISRLKVLLVSEENAVLIKNTDSILTKHSIIKAYAGLPEIAVQRVVLIANNVVSLANIQKSYHSAIASNNILNNLKSGITSLFNNFKGFLSLPSNVTLEAVIKLIDQTLGFSAQSIPVDFQYRYDLLKDLTDTYNEIRNLLPEINAECCPSAQSFPKHLMLGKLNNTEAFDEFRHSFYHSPISGNAIKNIEHFNSLMMRLFLLLNNYLAFGSEVILTPSKTKVDLSNRSIPFYYKTDEELLESWNFEKTRKLNHKLNLAYHRNNLSTAAHIQDPLKFNIDLFDFFRIEGIQNKPAEITEIQLKTAKTNYGLDFDLFSFDIDSNQTELQQFIVNNNSLEHQAGVGKGGSFLLLKKSNLIVADFALNYKYRAEQAESCCKISECSYPWISSLKYLNNLSRSTKGTQSNKQLMPKAYRLLIMQYTINGVSLITSPTEISIPLGLIFNSRMHAVTRKLNERFPTGLVFDFDQESKLLKIKKLKEDTFTLIIRDISIANTSPIYTFTEKAMLKNGKALQSKAIVCAEVNQHLKSFYQQLHSKYEPTNKDDDYGQYDEKWARWDDLMQKLKHHKLFKEIAAKRFPLAVADLPKEVQAELRQIRADIAQTVPNSKVWLSGEWTSGSWVNQNMITYFNANRKNTHDDLVLFMQMRERLHQRNGKSKYSLFIDPVTDVQLKAIQTKYLNRVDFYAGKAGGIVIEV